MLNFQMAEGFIPCLLLSTEHCSTAS